MTENTGVSYVQVGDEPLLVEYTMTTIGDKRILFLPLDPDDVVSTVYVFDIRIE